MQLEKNTVEIAPLMTKEKFSELTGLGIHVIQGMMNRGHLPTTKLGRRRLINTSLIHRENLDTSKFSY